MTEDPPKKGRGRVGAGPAVETQRFQFEDEGRTLEIIQFPGKNPHFVLEYEGRGESERVVVDPTVVLEDVDRGFRPDGEKLREFLAEIEGDFLDSAREHIQNQDPPGKEAERGMYYSVLALLHTPKDQSELDAAREKVKGRMGGN